MAKGYQRIGIRHLDTLFRFGTAGELTDAQLLDRYTSRRDETAELAFAVLVERHGPMVLRVCRAVLRNSHEAHDAFQATFLVLVRRAGSLWVRDSLGPWLLQVAHRTACGARSAMARRRRHEGRAAELTVRPAHNGDCEDLCAVVHEEVGRLPERYRGAVVLCLLEGLTPEQAARHLNCPAGTVHSRLARGRVRLRDRLTRRGLGPAVDSVAAILAPELAFAEVPNALVEAAVRNAIPIASGSGAAGVVPAVACALSREVLRSMLMAKARTAAVSLLLFGVISAGVAVRGQQGSTDNPGPTKNVEVQEVKPSAVVQGLQTPGRTPESYATAKSLKEALRIAKRPVEGDRKLDHPYDALLILLTEERVRETIPIAIKNYETLEGRHPEELSAGLDYFRSLIKPRLIKIAKEGVWPEGCSFTYFPVSEEKDGKHRCYGYSLTLEVHTPGEKYPLFALPIIKVEFGKFGEILSK